jgi:hypothetical protein
MSRVILTLFVLPVAGSADAAIAQEEAPPQPTAVVFSYWKCDYGELDAIRQITDSVTVPIAQELVNEGMWVGYGELRHAWADEWNVVYYYLAQDIPTFLSGWQQFASRITERHPDLFNWFTERCPEHKDNIYNWGPRTTPPPAPPGQ